MKRRRTAGGDPAVGYADPEIESVSSRLPVFLSILTGLLAGCAADETAILLEVCTNLPPSQADELRLLVSGAGGSDEKTYALDEVGMPFEISLRPGRTIRGAIEVTAVLTLREAPVVSRSVGTAFVEGSDADLRIFLDRACIDLFCPGDLTCKAGDCGPAGGGDLACAGGPLPGLDAALPPERDSGAEPDSGREPDAGAGLDAGRPCPGCSCDHDGDCGPGEVCLDGVCTTQCATSADCPYGDPCVGGFCGCPPGLVDCYGNCVDLMNDDDNCGSCDWVCELGDDCVDGECQFEL